MAFYRLTKMNRITGGETEEQSLTDTIALKFMTQKKLRQVFRALKPNKNAASFENNEAETSVRLRPLLKVAIASERSKMRHAFNRLLL